MARLLVVEDDADLRWLLRLTFEREGHAVTSTESGVKAVQLASRGDYDLVLLDVDLEEDLSGEGVMKALLDLGPMPIVAVTTRRGRSHLLEAGATACMPKPYSLTSLAALVRSILRTEAPTEARWPTNVRQLSTSDLTRLASLSPRELDALPFGAIAIGRDGRIVEFNAYEEDASSYARPTVLGMSFAEVAPCASVEELGGRIDDALARGQPLDHVLRFVFPRHGATALVSVRLHHDPTTDRAWVFVSKWRGT